MWSNWAQYIFTAFLSGMPFTAWLCYTLTILLYKIIANSSVHLLIKELAASFLSVYKVSIKRIWIKYWTTSRFILSKNKYIFCPQFKCVIVESGCCLINYCQLSRHKNLGLIYTCQLSPLRRESHACGLKTSISRRLMLASQFLTPDWKMWAFAVLLDTIAKNMLTQTHVRNKNHV